jgi:hypothetical protein
MVKEFGENIQLHSLIRKSYDTADHFGRKRIQNTDRVQPSSPQRLEHGFSPARRKPPEIQLVPSYQIRILYPNAGVSQHSSMRDKARQGGYIPWHGARRPGRTPSALPWQGCRAAKASSRTSKGAIQRTVHLFQPCHLHLLLLPCHDKDRSPSPPINPCRRSPHIGDQVAGQDACTRVGDDEDWRCCTGTAMGTHLHAPVYRIAGGRHGPAAASAP